MRGRRGCVRRDYRSKSVTDLYRDGHGFRDTWSKPMNDTAQPRYWEGRWRDEKAENERLLQEIADLQSLLKLANIDMRITTQLSRSIRRNSRLANVLSDALALLEQ